jgi:hypothetical protein
MKINTAIPESATRGIVTLREYRSWVARPGNHIPKPLKDGTETRQLHEQKADKKG